MSFAIRHMEKDDIQAVQHIAKKSWNATYEGIIPLGIQENFLKATYSDEMMEKRLQGSLWYVAVKEDEVAGFINLTPANQNGQSELSAIYLNPASQGAGIGTALLQRGIEEIVNLKELYVEVEEENVTGKKFYEAKGFKTIKEYEENFDGHLLQTIQMCLTV